MSIQSEISRIQSNVQDTINVIQSTGVAVPPGANSDNLPGLAAALANEKQDKLTGTQGQVVGFDAEGNAVAQEGADGADGMACRTCRFVIGTSTSGWTSDDCDYLCDGTDDQVEINAAIQALPSTGGEIVILDGTYNITATIAMNKDNVKLSGNGTATILKRMWDSSVTAKSVIAVTATNGGCCIENLQINGNKETYTSSNNCGIYLSSSNNTVTKNTCNNNNNGIYLFSSDNTVTGNTCNNNNYGIYMSGSNNNTVTGNTCNNNNYGIYLSGNNSTVTGNTCNNNNRGIYLSGSNDNTVTGNTCNNNNYGIYLSGNNSTVTGNTCNNNTYHGIRMLGDNNTVTGNTCSNNAIGIYLYNGSNNTVTGNTCNNNNNGIYLSNSSNSTVTGNICIRGTGQASDYTSSQYTIRLSGTSSNYNLIACNNIMGKNYTSEGGAGNTFVNNKYN